MVCLYCNSWLFVTSVWFSKKNNYQYSYICFCVVNACFEMEQLTFDNKPEMIKTAPEEVNLDTIAQTVKRYYKPPLKKHNLKVDIDLSKGKLLTEQEYDKFFNLKLSKTPLRKPTPKKEKEKVYSLDYRTVND